MSCSVEWQEQASTSWSFCSLCFGSWKQVCVFCQCECRLGFKPTIDHPALSKSETSIEKGGQERGFKLTILCFMLTMSGMGTIWNSPWQNSIPLQPAASRLFDRESKSMQSHKRICASAVMKTECWCDKSDPIRLLCWCSTQVGLFLLLDKTYGTRGDGKASTLMVDLSCTYPRYSANSCWNMPFTCS